MMEKYSQKISEIREKIKNAAISANRDPSDITLVAATKTQNAENVRAAIASGVDACGENRVQEMTAKLLENAYDGVPLHFIGHLQTNKVRDVVGRVSLIQSVDSLKLAQEINSTAQKLGVKQDVLLEIKLGDEPNKTGFNPNELMDILKLFTHYECIAVRGLMTIPPIVCEHDTSMEHFRYLHKIFVDITPLLLDNGDKHILSMGMSGDYEQAISAGATMVRVGTAIFGER